MFKFHAPTVRRALLAAGLSALLALAPGQAGAAAPAAGAVYTLTNAGDGNGLAVFNRNAEGVLAPAGIVPTGGTGTGGGLHNQGALALSPNGLWLFGVNPGNDTVSMFSLQGRMPRLVAVSPSGGHLPNSLTVHGNLLYVLHTGGDNGGVDSIVGFRITTRGLVPLPGSSRPLSAASTSPAQVAFTPNGNLLIVTEHGANHIDTYQINAQGYATGPKVQLSRGKTPFGFGFSPGGKLIVSEAQGAAAGASTVSLYNVGPDGTLTVEIASLPTHQSAACWITVDSTGHYAYTSNSPSATLSGLSVDDGAESLSLLNPHGGVTGWTGHGSTPTDGAIVNGRVLYILNSGLGQIEAFSIHADGSLSFLDLVWGFPASGTGLAAR